MEKIKNNKVLFLILLVLLVAILVGCERGLETVDMEITEFPDNIVYFVGYDSGLDLTGGVIKLTSRIGSERFVDMSEEGFEELANIIHSIDFNREGVYTVKIEIPRKPELYVIFPVQVIQLEPEDEQ